MVLQIIAVGVEETLVSDAKRKQIRADARGIERALERDGEFDVIVAK